MAISNKNIAGSKAGTKQKVLLFFWQLLVMPIGACLIYYLICIFEQDRSITASLWLAVLFISVVIVALALNNRERINR